jgi:hypothetical protein
MREKRYTREKGVAAWSDHYDDQVLLITVRLTPKRE